MKKLHLLLLGAVLSVNSIASLPDFKASAEECQEYLEERANLASSVTGFSQIHVPLSTFYLSTRDPFQAVLAKVSDTIAKTPVSPGLMRLINSAKFASESILEAMPEAKKAVRPDYPVGDFEKGYEATQLLMLSEGPEFIREAVLIRDGVVTIVPLLKRVVKKSSETGFPVYIPIIIRGHQEVQDWDIFAASFASWAIETVQQTTPPHALIYIKPMARIRKKAATLIEPFTRITPRVHFSKLEQASSELKAIWESLDVALSIEPRRNTFTSKSKYLNFILEILKGQKSLWMLPFPPKGPERHALMKLGYNTTDELAEIDINSTAFMRASVASGISPKRLRKYIARARARKEDRIIVLESFVDPFLDAKGRNKFTFHTDFEDFGDARFIGGVFLVGWAIENAKDKKIQAGHFLAENANQEDFDLNIAQLLRVGKTNRHLAGKDFATTVYSHHEETKIRQHLGIIKDKPRVFSEDEKNSIFYTERTSSGGMTMGNLITRTEFFDRFSDIEPSDVWTFIDRFVDLLPYQKNNIISGSFTQGLKTMVDIYGTPEISIDYPSGYNGLEVQVWAGDSYSTGNPEGLENSVTYVGIDVDGNRIMKRVIQKYAGKPVDKDFRWSASMERHLEKLDYAAEKSRKVVSLKNKKDLLETLFAKKLKDVSAKALGELEDILDRSAYLSKREAIRNDSGLMEMEKRRLLKQAQVAFEDERAGKLVDFFEAHFEKRRVKGLTRGMFQSHLAKFLSIPTMYLGAAHIDKMQVLEQIAANTPSVSAYKNMRRGLGLPDEWVEKLKEFNQNRFNANGPWNGWRLPLGDLDSTDYQDLWEGIYYAKLFQIF